MDGRWWLLVAGAAVLGALAATLLLNHWSRSVSARAARARQAAAAAERARLAREMHDSLSKTLDAVALGAAALQGTLNEPDRASRLARTLHEGTLDAARDARALIDDLRANPGDLPLSDTVLALCREWEAGSGVPVTVEIGAGSRSEQVELDGAAGLELCWILREALRNVRAHAAATRVWVGLKYGRGGGRLILTIRDDGVGFTPPGELVGLQRGGRHGLVGMTERARVTGGDLTVEARPGRGTTVRAVVPASVSPRTQDTGTGDDGVGWRLRVAVPVLVALVFAGLMVAAARGRSSPPPARALPSAAPSAAPAVPGPTVSGPAGSAAAPPVTAVAPALSASAPPVTAGSDRPADVPAGRCKVRYLTRDQWNVGFVADLTVTNTGSTAVEDWTLTFAFDAGQRVVSGWNSVVSQDGTAVTVEATADNPVLAPRTSVVIGVQGTWSGRNPEPAAFFLNGRRCA